MGVVVYRRGPQVGLTGLTHFFGYDFWLLLVFSVVVAYNDNGFMTMPHEIHEPIVVLVCGELV